MTTSTSWEDEFCNDSKSDLALDLVSSTPVRLSMIARNNPQEFRSRLFAASS